MKTLNSASTVYENVGRQQVHLTREKEIELVYRYKAVKDKLHWYILDRERCRQSFISKYREIKAAGRSAAKLSADYNPRKAGLNKSIEQKMSLQLDPAVVRRKSTRRGHSLAEALFDLNLSDAVYAELVLHLKPTAALKKIQDEISEIEDVLFRSMLQAGCEIAKKYASRLLGIDEADANQEVNLYLLESIRRYDPLYRTAKGKRVKLCTYAYNRSEKLLREWILTNSRLVRIPRSKMERILIVVKAYDVLTPHQINLPELVAGANRIMRERKGKLTKANIFSIDEVDDLIKILLSTYIHLDQPYKKSNRANQPTIGDMLVNHSESVVDAIEDNENKDQLFEVMRSHLTKREYQVIMLRYFHDPSGKVPKALKEIGPLLESVYGGTNYSRESIRLLEESAFVKLKDVEEVRELWMN